MDVKLVMFKSNGQRRDFPVINPTTVIGRGENCDLRVPLLSVSRRHCELLLEGGRLLVKDMGSSNGTYVNNKRVSTSAVTAGDRLVVGPIVFTVQVDGVPEQIHPVKTKGQILAETGSADAEEIITLEEDIVGQPGASALEDSAIIDPIAALEALARQQEKKK